MSKPLTIAGIGCGGRTLAYCDIAARMPHRYQVVAGADPLHERVELVREAAKNPTFRGFANADALFAAGKLADVAVIGTQDAYHVVPAIRAMELGYDVLLEKPIAPNPSQVMEVLAASERLGRKVLICHVLRYTPFYTTLKDILATGVIGDLATIEASEGVEYFHQAHSFVRGHWAVTAKSNPMIISKSCHDMDIISWLVDRPCLRVASFGGRQFFTAAQAPDGAPERCTDGCPVGDTCPYNSLHYTAKQRPFLQHVMPGGRNADYATIINWLKTSPWGRCVFRCDNDVVDRQVVAMDFADGIAGTFTMTAFDDGRSVVITGTKGVITGGEALKKQTGYDILVRTHHGLESRYKVPTEVGGYSGHGGGDPGLILALDHELAKPARAMRSGLHASVESHMMGFAAEEARLTKKVVDLAEFRARHSASL